MAKHQSFHELFQREEELKHGSDRSFCFVFAGIFAIAFASSAYHHHDRAPLWLAVSAILAGIGLLRPTLASPLNRLWARIGLLLHHITNPVILTLLYVVAIVPIGLILQCVRKRKTPPTSSYWVLRKPPGPAPQSMSDQF